MSHYYRNNNLYFQQNQVLILGQIFLSNYYLLLPYCLDRFYIFQDSNKVLELIIFFIVLFMF